MEKNISIILGLLISTFLNLSFICAQTVNSSGETIKKDNFEITYTLGETFNSITEGATEGFLAGSSIIIEEITDIKSSLDFQISIYPNPSSNYINLESKNTNQNIKIFLIDANGKNNLSSTSLNSEGKTQISIQNLNAGIYFIKILDEQSPEKTQIFKIIKK